MDKFEQYLEVHIKAARERENKPAGQYWNGLSEGLELALEEYRKQKDAPVFSVGQKMQFVSDGEIVEGEIIRIEDNITMRWVWDTGGDMTQSYTSDELQMVIDVRGAKPIEDESEEQS